LCSAHKEDATKTIVLQKHFQFDLALQQFILNDHSELQKTFGNEDDMDPIQAMYTHGAMPDDGNDALFAVANLGFGVESHPEVGPNSLAHDVIKEEKLIYIHIDLEKGGETVGIIQMPAIAHDSTTNSRFGNAFNMYVKPPPHIKAKNWAHRTGHPSLWQDHSRMNGF
jgi:hypothetical protein